MEIIKKFFLLEHGAIFIISAPVSYYLKRLVDILSEGVHLRDVVVPIFCFGLLHLCYVVITFVDFATGIKASKFEHKKEFGHTKGYIKSEKLWSSAWKFAIVLIVGSIVTVFDVIFAIAKMDILHYAFLFLIIFVYVIFISFDLHSIGENQERRFGKKDPIFDKLDLIFRIVGNILIGRFKSALNTAIGKDYENENNK